MNNKTPSYLKVRLPPFHKPYLFSENFSNSFPELRCRSLRYSNSFFPNAIAFWYIIIKDFDTVSSFEILKGHIISIIRSKTKSIFGLRYLFQLRVSLSSLRSHKMRHNFLDIPSDICHCNIGIEDTNHFLFPFSSYAIQRATLATSINEILRNNNLMI